MLELLDFPFIQRALFAGLMIGIVSPLIGTFLVLRRLSFIGDTLSHTTLAGVAAGFLFGFYPIISGMVFAVLAALGIDFLRKTYQHYGELSMPIMMSAGIGVALVLISLSDGFTVDLFSYLFGSILAVTKIDLITIVTLGIIIILTIMLLYKELLYISFDEEGARLSGIPYQRINLIFIILVALTIASSMRIVGVLLVSSMMTIPVATSLQISNSFNQTILYSVFFAELSIIIGFFIAANFELSSGGTMVLVSVGILLLTILIKRLSIFILVKH
ncbi:metal ABC transporter permease [Vulcanibacillus modesticaldus]|uniref:Metal ABC transporter permease n=1 Tax=Vulcanibacillus modesticaldus TaxID=337097 RepID=A0A1D2YUR2_9BACI|nr:metal ABC transporter permease [Vulcanibacillus modesticaldus]OEF99376.1 metal ABC transporter permease [Vulcanibacillus modesticaldus]